MFEKYDLEFIKLWYLPPVLSIIEILCGLLIGWTNGNFNNLIVGCGAFSLIGFSLMRLLMIVVNPEKVPKIVFKWMNKVSMFFLVFGFFIMFLFIVNTSHK